jgi:hypothetical protein
VKHEIYGSFGYDYHHGARPFRKAMPVKWGVLEEEISCPEEHLK